MPSARRIWLCLVSAAVAFGDQVPLLQDAPTNRSIISQSLFDDLEENARIVDIAYCVGVTGLGIQKPFECLSRCKDFESFELVTTWNTGPLLSDSCGYIALSHPPSPRRVIVAFRGTYSLANTIADLSTVPQAYTPYPGGDDDQNKPPQCQNCTVHMGFYSSWLNTRDEILPHIDKALHDNPGYKLTLVGHSLGGAVAALAGLELQTRGYSPIVTTFGEPRTGNAAFADYVNGRFHTNGSVGTSDENIKLRRVTHASDPVPLLPLEEWGYMPHGGEIYIQKYSLPPDREDVYHCSGNSDPECSSGKAMSGNGWGISPRFKLWQLFFAHRDYFWRLGLCIPKPDFVPLTEPTV